MRRKQITLACIGLVLLCPLRGIARAQVCPIVATGNCQPPSFGFSCGPYRISDRLPGTRSADDFRPIGDTISRVCFSPCFLGAIGTNSYYCDGTAPNRGTPPPDNFILKIYEEDFGKPGLLLTGIPPEGVPLTIDAKAPATTCAGNRCWQYTAAVNPPDGIAVVPGECHCLEITGLGELQAQGTCYVLLQMANAANGISITDSNDDYNENDISFTDFSFCLDSGIAVATAPPDSLDGGCGTRPVTCCTKHIGCADNYPHSACATRNGVIFENATCADPEVAEFCAAPPNDLCADAIELTNCVLSNPGPIGWCSIPWWIPQFPYELCDPLAQDCLDPAAVCSPFSPARETYRCEFPVDNVQALTDGPSLWGTSCFGESHLESDIWYTFIAPCSGKVVVDGCPSDVPFDSMLLLYGDHTSTCRPCPITNNQFDLACEDDSCRSSPAAIGASITQGGCYTIRFGGYSQLGTEADAGQGVGTQTLSVICNGPPPATPSPAPAPHNRRKNRYISFNPNNDANVVAFRVVKTTAPTGSCWVQAPVQGGNDQYSAKCAAAPVFRVWSEPVIHVGDCEIVPVADYEIVTTFDGVVFSSPLSVSTILLPAFNNKLWGDVADVNNGMEWTAPNQFTNVNDILAVLAYISNAAIKPTFQMVNLQAVSFADPCLNTFANTADVLAVVLAASGGWYPFTTNPGACPVCP